MSRKRPLPLVVAVTTTGVTILIAMSGVAFLTYALYRGLIAAFGLSPWASALATGGGAFIGAAVYTAIVGGFVRWRHGLHRQAEHYKRADTYLDQLETEIDTRLDKDVSHAIFSHPKGATALGLAVGVATGASRDLRRLLLEVLDEFRH